MRLTLCNKKMIEKEEIRKKFLKSFLKNEFIFIKVWFGHRIFFARDHHLMINFDRTNLKDS